MTISHLLSASSSWLCSTKAGRGGRPIRAVGRRDNGQLAPHRPLFLRPGGSCRPGLLCPIRRSRELLAQTQTPDAPGWLVDSFQPALGKLREAINQTPRPNRTMGSSKFSCELSQGAGFTDWGLPKAGSSEKNNALCRGFGLKILGGKGGLRTMTCSS